MDIERRVAASNFRILGEEGNTLIGYAAVFNQLSEDLGGFVEMIEPGSFSDVLDDDVRALINHDSNLILGRTPNTLEIEEDDLGLRYSVDLPDTTFASDLKVSLERGDVSQSSFGFRVAVDEWHEPDEDRQLHLRIIKKFKRLFDVSPVTFPAYPQTDVALRSLENYLADRVDTSVNSNGVRRLPILKRKLYLIEKYGSK